MTRVDEQTLWVRGRAGWQGQQGSTTGLVVLCAFLALAGIATALIWLFDPAPAIKAMGASALGLVVLAGWMFVAHLRVGRVRVVRVASDGGRVQFRGAREVALPTRLLAVVGLALLASWAWAVFTAPADSLPIVTLLGVPVVAIAATFVGVRALLPGTGSHSLIMTPERLTVRIPRNDLDVSWDEVEGAELTQNRVHVSARGRAGVSFAARDFASDPVILADLITYYARTPAARSSIGAGTLDLLTDGSF